MTLYSLYRPITIVILGLPSDKTIMSHGLEFDPEQRLAVAF